MHAAAKIEVNLAQIFIFSLLLNHTHLNTVMMAAGKRFAVPLDLLDGGLSLNVTTVVTVLPEIKSYPGGNCCNRIVKKGAVLE
jgi:hypothetical protein